MKTSSKTVCEIVYCATALFYLFLQLGCSNTAQLFFLCVTDTIILRLTLKLQHIDLKVPRLLSPRLKGYQHTDSKGKVVIVWQNSCWCTSTVLLSLIDIPSSFPRTDNSSNVGNKGLRGEEQNKFSKKVTSTGD